MTAGPTYERIDPVRFIGNFSTGKMGIAIAETLAEQGATVTLVLGPSHLQSIHRNIKLIRVENAEQMYNACIDIFPVTQIAVLSAAVADYRPAEMAQEKIKKSSEALDIQLVKNKDILATLGGLKKDGQLLVGFALETTDELNHAMGKLKAKNADMIVLNSLKDSGAGFGHDTNKVTLLDTNGGHKELPLQSKQDVANTIVNHIVKLRHAEKAI